MRASHFKYLQVICKKTSAVGMKGENTTIKIAQPNIKKSKQTICKTKVNK